MANTLFLEGRRGFLDGSIDWDTNDIRLVLVDHGIDTPLPNTDQTLTDIAAGARVKISDGAGGLFSSKTTPSGIADAADITLTAVSGNSVESIVIYADTGTSRLIAFIDTATGLPFTPNSGDVTIAWSNATSKIFML